MRRPTGAAPAPTAAAAAVIGVLSLALLASCFSERRDLTGVVEGECTIPASAGGSVVVAIRDFAFHPAEVTVRQGTSITWVNCEEEGVEAHTSTSGGWSTALLEPGDHETIVFDDVGEFDYWCAPHPAIMTGRVIVE